MKTLWMAVALSIMTLQPATAQLKIAIEAHKSAIVNLDSPDETAIEPFPGNTLPGTNFNLSYISFDLTALPPGSRIADASISVFDLEPNFSEDFNTIGLLNVAADWDSSTMSFNQAVELYGAAIVQNQDGANVVGFNSEKLLWSGKAKMDNLNAPGSASVNSTRNFESVDPFTLEDLVEALNAAVSTGDGFVTLAIYGDFPYDNLMTGINYPEEAGPTLTLTLGDDSALGFRSVYNFDNGDLDGWEQVMTSTMANGPTALGLISTADPAVGNSVPPLPLSGTTFIGPVPFEAEDGTNTRDQAHETLILRSPEFTIYPNGQISFALIGGSKPDFDLADVNANGLPSASSGSGPIGVALREVSSGDYLTFHTRSENGGQFWETITLGEQQLAGLVKEDETYTLDFIDANSGGWGWAGLDSVVVQEGTPVLNYNFDDKTLQGWQVVTSSTTPNGPAQLGVISDSDPAVGNSVPPLPLTAPSFIGPVPFEAEDGTNTRDQAHETLILRSPEFTIYPNGQISFALIGGAKPNFDMEAINANGLPATSSGSGAIGVALREVSSGDYLTFNSRAEDGGQFWETITLGEDVLSGKVQDNEKYTLDFIDFSSGGWGWAGLDSVQIRQGTPDKNYNFDDGTAQGWTSFRKSTTANGPTELGLISTSDPAVGNSVPPLPLSAPSFIGPVPFEAEDGTNTRDQAHETLVFRSPEFNLFKNGQISFALIGGSKPTFDMAAINSQGLPAQSSGSGSIGVALRNASTDQYLTYNSRTENGGQFWETITLDSSVLAPIVDENAMYTLDFIDFHNGGWGWAGLDNVSIKPGRRTSNGGGNGGPDDDGKQPVLGVTPIVPEGLTDAGTPYEAPGMYPYRLTAANVDISLPVGTTLGGDGSNDMKVKFPSMGPIDWTDARHNEGDIAFNIGAATPGVTPPDEFREHRPGGGDPLDGTTFAWTVDNRHGVGFATTRANGFDNQDLLADGSPVGTRYGVAYFSHQFRSGFGYSPVDGVFGNGNFAADALLGIIGQPDEAVFDIALSFFPYSEGWIAGQVVGGLDVDPFVSRAPVQFLNQANGGSIGYGVEPSLIQWFDANNDSELNEGFAELALPGVQNAAEDGMLFVAPSDGSSNTKIAGATPSGEYWSVTLRDDRTTNDDPTLAPREQSGFSFLYLPWDTRNLVGGYVNGADGSTYKKAGTFTLTQSGEGTYELTLPGKTGDDGVLILSNAGAVQVEGVSMASPAFFSYEYDAARSVFVIESHELTFDGVFPVNSDFYFAWVDFENPMQPAPMAAPRIIRSVAFGDSYQLDPNDALSTLPNQFAGVAVNTKSPELLVTTIFNGYNLMDPGNSFGFLSDPVTGNENNGVLIGYRVNTITGARIGEPFIIIGNPNGEIQRNDVAYNPVSDQYVVVAEARGMGVNGLNIPVIALVSSTAGVDAGAENVVNTIKHDEETTISYQDVGIAVSSVNGNFMIVAEYQPQGVGEAVSGFIYDKDGLLLSQLVNRLDTIEPDRDEDDPDVSYLPMADLFLFNTNIDPAAGEPNRISLTAVRTSPDSNGNLITGTQQIVSATRVEAQSQGHPSVIENPFNGELIIAFDYGNGAAGGDLVYVKINTDLSFSETRPQAPYLVATGNDPFGHRHPQMAVDSNRCYFLLAHNANGGASVGTINGMAFTLLDRDGQVLGGRSESFFGFHNFLRTPSTIDNGSNFNDVAYDPASRKFFAVYNDQSGATRLVSLALEVSAEDYQAYLESLNPPVNEDDIVDLVLASPDLSTLRDALNLANLAGVLQGDGPFTVFAPVNSAFAKIPADDLQAILANNLSLANILTYHVVPGKILAADIVPGANVTTVNGETFQITRNASGAFFIGQSQIVQADILATNGVVHLIDTVLIPSVINPLAGLEDITAPGDAITPVNTRPDGTHSPANEEVDKAIDNLTTTKYLNRDGVGSGLVVTPSAGASIVLGLSITSGNDSASFPERNPTTYLLEGSNDGNTFVQIASGPVPRFTDNFQTRFIAFDNTQSFTSYRLTFPALIGTGLMQVSEIELLAQPTSRASITGIRIQNGQITFSYTGTLQSAPSVNGPWTDVAGATSPYSEATSADARFFRVVQ